LPIFIDEALYVRWIDTISANFNQFLLPLIEDGQPPLFFVLGALIKNIFSIGDSLLLIRGLSVFFGGLTLLAGILLVKEVSKSNLSALLFAWSYAIIPFLLIHDRLGMRDSALGFTMLASFYFYIKW